MSAVSIAVLTDLVLLAEGLERILAAEASLVVHRAIDDTFARSSSSPGPDIVLIDSNLSDALLRCAALKTEEPPVIFIGAPDDDRWGLDALRAGARGLVAASASRETLIRAIQTVHQGAMWVPRRLLTASLDQLPAMSPLRRQAIVDQLSAREREVFRYAATGLSNKELAQQLHIAEATVKVHLVKIFAKLRINGRAELAAAYHGISRAVDREPSLQRPAATFPPRPRPIRAL